MDIFTIEHKIGIDLAIFCPTLGRKKLGHAHFLYTYTSIVISKDLKLTCIVYVTQNVDNCRM